MFRKNLLLVLLTFSSLFALAQSPLEFNYQAVARDQKGIPLDKREIKVRFSIRSNAPDGAVEYMEIRELETNPFGMFTVSIGSTGAFFSSGSLSDVKWENGKKFLQVEIDVKGGNDYKNLGATQMVSVPYALFALKTLDRNKIVSNYKAGNGISIKDSTFLLGNSEGDTSNGFSENRVILLKNNSLSLKGSNDKINFQSGEIRIQQDSAFLLGDTVNSGGSFFRVDPIFPRPDALPFVFSRLATKQHNGSVSPNEVVMWGHNLGGGGGPLISGLPAIGYSIESNYKPNPDARLVESHEYYVTPQGQQIRLKSYTITTGVNWVDFYHSADNFYIKNPRTSEPYFRIDNNKEGEEQQLTLGLLKLDINNVNKQIQFRSLIPGAEMIFSTGGWGNIYFPGSIIQWDGLHRQQKDFIAENDNAVNIGGSGNRFKKIYGVNFVGAKMALYENWQPYTEMIPSSTLDIEGINGYNQFRLRKTYTPTGSSDPNGNTGDMSWDDNYIYIKTSAGWKRTSLESF